MTQFQLTCSSIINLTTLLLQLSFSSLTSPNCSIFDTISSPLRRQCEPGHPPVEILSPMPRKAHLFKQHIYRSFITLKHGARALTSRIPLSEFHQLRHKQNPDLESRPIENPIMLTKFGRRDSSYLLPFPIPLALEIDKGSLSTHSDEINQLVDCLCSEDGVFCFLCRLSFSW
jgi:hypothetical protein